MNDLGTKSLLSSEERRCGRPDKVDLRTNALINLRHLHFLPNHLFFVLTAGVATARISRAYLVSNEGVCVTVQGGLKHDMHGGPKN